MKVVAFEVIIENIIFPWWFAYPQAAAPHV
jgi:hypothetical protein